jgi:metal-dependent hydrolase (beta-lactamase superfamily II)
MNIFLIQTSTNNILIDTGLGVNTLESFQKLNVQSEQIDSIFITHMHPDHIGGLIVNDKFSFPNAKLYISKNEVDFWLSDEEMNKVVDSKKPGFILAQHVISAYQK